MALGKPDVNDIIRRIRTRGQRGGRCLPCLAYPVDMGLVPKDVDDDTHGGGR
jgi:hypothetical protein